MNRWSMCGYGCGGSERKQLVLAALYDSTTRFRDLVLCPPEVPDRLGNDRHGSTPFVSQWEHRKGARSSPPTGTHLGEVGSDNRLEFRSLRQPLGHSSHAATDDGGVVGEIWHRRRDPRLGPLRLPDHSESSRIVTSLAPLPEANGSRLKLWRCRAIQS
jgi:hypothetical protein